MTSNKGLVLMSIGPALIDIDTQLLSTLAEELVRVSEPSYGYFDAEGKWSIAWGTALMEAGVPYCIVRPFTNTKERTDTYNLLLNNADRISYVRDRPGEDIGTRAHMYIIDKVQAVVILDLPYPTLSLYYKRSTCRRD